MKVFKYIRYFFFIAINWSPRLAWFTISHEINGEKRYGINTTGTGIIGNTNFTGDVLDHAQSYQGANYYLLEKIFDFLNAETTVRNCVDFGCGQGRILCVAAWHGFSNITGIDISPTLLKIARENIELTQKIFPDTRFTLVEENAANYLIDSATNVLFFFNPFDEIIMIEVVKNIMQSLKENDRELFIAYINPLHKEIFQAAGFSEVFYEEKFEFIECSILMYSAEV